MWDAGAVYELRSAEPVISESACSLWPTARAEDSESCGNHPGATDSLTGATRNWPTPHTNCTTGAGSQGRDGGDNLQTTVDLWQTPATDSFRSRGGDRKDEMGLDQEARHWKTPHGMSNKDYKG